MSLLMLWARCMLILGCMGGFRWTCLRIYNFEGRGWEGDGIKEWYGDMYVGIDTH